MDFPSQAQTVMNRLNRDGYEAYLVGGCVRDKLLGTEPHDWDITTSALPEEIKRSLADFRLIETGIKHGTITALVDRMPIEITTYRMDGTYSDHRHPDCVSFTRSLQDDLSRRDFTINALAYNPVDGVVDCFGGQDDLRNECIRCVGEPDLRFQEDGLRILRALRFAATLGFDIEPKTADSIVKNCELLKTIALERIRMELIKLLCGQNAEPILRSHRTVFEQFLPEIHCMAGFPQNNPYHIYDVWEHTLKSLSAIQPNSVLRMTMLLHDCGKPSCFTQDENRIGHFHGHNIKSTEIAHSILQRLRFDSKTTNQILTLVTYHDLAIIPEEKLLRRQLNKLGEETMLLLLKVRKADMQAQNPDFGSRLDELDQAELVLNHILESGQCFSLGSLNIHGDDLIALGIPQGAKIGKTLAVLLNEVIDGKYPNDFDTLLIRANQIKDELL